MTPLNEIYNDIRILAKTPYWQTIYGQAKEIHMKIFENDRDLTNLQVLFLNYLGFYSIINLDIAMGDIEPIVKDDFIYEDAWMFYKQKRRIKKETDTVKQNTSSLGIQKEVKQSTTKIVFRRKQAKK